MLSVTSHKQQGNFQLNHKLKSQQGFTLIELITGIVVLTISLSIVSTLIAPAEEKSADNVLQIKASELAQSLMNDITSRAFDHNSDMSGGLLRCDETAAPACTDNNKLGPEDGNGTPSRSNAGEDANDRSTFNDVDDFDGFSETVNSITLKVSVEYAGADLGLAHPLAKRITITATTPLGTAIEFTSHKANF